MAKGDRGGSEVQHAGVPATVLSQASLKAVRQKARHWETPVMC